MSRLTGLQGTLVAEFLRFGCAGTVGFVVDTATVYSLRRSVGLYAAGLAAYLVAATVTWSINRAWTFRGRGASPAHRQWALFLAVNLLGLLLNRGTYALIVANYEVARSRPVIAVAAGAIAGMFVNFASTRRLVFGPAS